VATITDANHNILGKATVSNGTANVSINGTLTVGSQLTLCVFGYNKVTYLGTINVVGGTQYTIGATASPQEAGTVNGAGQYYESTQCTLTATANNGYTFINWTKDNQEVSTNASFTFTVTENANYVANFRQNLSIPVTLEKGWNWWAPNGETSLADFEQALQGNGIKIIDQAGNYVEYDSELGWSSNNNLVLEVGKMYMVQMARNFTANLNGFVVNPADHLITLDSGSNWVGFIGTQEMTLDQAFAGFTPNNLDNIKTQEGSSTYYNSRGWVGRVTSLVPGQGFIYKSKASTTQTFYYPAQ
jgi:uncharacterized repeat protein (TIGR02543 family)